MKPVAIFVFAAAARVLFWLPPPWAALSLAGFVAWIQIDEWRGRRRVGEYRSTPEPEWVSCDARSTASAEPGRLFFLCHERKGHDGPHEASFRGWE